MNKTSKLVAFAVGAALLGLSVSGCAASNNTAGDDDMGGMDHGSSHSMTIKDKQSFAEAMIPHHQQAVDISEFAAQNTTNPGTLAIAEKIISEQGPEIEKMTPWLNGKSVDYTMMMDGMLSTTQINTLRGVKNADFDMLYVQYMIEHHEGAVKMAADALGLDDPELTDFANEIIVTQSAEIEELMALLNN